MFARAKDFSYLCMIFRKLTTNMHNNTIKITRPMKLNQTLKVSTMLLVLAVVLFACKESPYVPEPGDNNEAGSNTFMPVPSVDKDDVTKFPNFTFPDGTLTPDPAKKFLTVKQAIAEGRKLGNNKSTSDKYYIYGYVSGWNKEATESSQKNAAGSLCFYIKDNPTDLENFYCYRAYAGASKKKFSSLEDLPIGTVVIMYTYIYNYGGTIETSGSDNAYIYVRTCREPELTTDGTLENPYSIADMCKVINYVDLGGSAATEDVYVKGYAVGLGKVGAADPIKGEDLRLDSTKFVADGTDINILLADDINESIISNMAVVDLEGRANKTIRNSINLQFGTDKVDVYHKQVLIKGNINKTAEEGDHFPGNFKLVSPTYVKLENGKEISK